MSSLSTRSLRVLLSVMLKKSLEIRELLEEPPDAMLPSLVTLKMELRPELDFHLEPERLSVETVELLLVFNFKIF